MNAVDPSGHKIKLVGGKKEKRREYKRAIAYIRISKTGKKLIKKIKNSKEVFEILTPYTM